MSSPTALWKHKLKCSPPSWPLFLKCFLTEMSEALFIHSLQPPLPFSKLSVFHFLILLHVSNHSPFFRNTLVPQLPSHQPPRFLSPGPALPPPYTKHHTCNRLHHLSYLLLVD